MTGLNLGLEAGAGVISMKIIKCTFFFRDQFDGEIGWFIVLCSVFQNYKIIV